MTAAPLQGRPSGCRGTTAITPRVTGIGSRTLSITNAALTVASTRFNDNGNQTPLLNGATVSGAAR